MGTFQGRSGLMKRSAVGLVAILLFAISTAGLRLTAAGGSQAGPGATPPDKFFGFQLGADRQMARWDKIVEYFQMLEKESPRIKVLNMGPTTMGNPFLLVTISAPSNLAKLEDIRQTNLKISDPRGIAEADVKKLVAQGKVVMVQSMSMHATEIGGTQMAPEFAYDLASRNDEETTRILDNVVFLMVPSFNPDGQIMVTDWYRKTLGTDYEGISYPSLYHKYVGHDNNRDAFQTNVVESQYMAKILFRDWKPAGVHRSPPHGELRRSYLRAAVRRAGQAVRRSACLARAQLVRRAHRLQRGRGRQVRNRERRDLFRLGTFRVPLDHAVPQHRRDADRVG